MDELITAAINKLKQAGFRACAAFPAFRLPRLSAPVAAVSFSEFRLSPAARGDYFGKNAAQQVHTGERLDGTLQFDLYSPYLSGGSTCTEAALGMAEALRSGLNGCTLCSVHCGKTSYDAKTDCFRATVTAEISAWCCRTTET